MLYVKIKQSDRKTTIGWLVGWSVEADFQKKKKQNTNKTKKGKNNPKSTLNEESSRCNEFHFVVSITFTLLPMEHWILECGDWRPTNVVKWKVISCTEWYQRRFFTNIYLRRRVVKLMNILVALVTSFKTMHSLQCPTGIMTVSLGVPNEKSLTKDQSIQSNTIAIRKKFTSSLSYYLNVV